MKRLRETNINTVDYWDQEWKRREDHPELEQRFDVVAEILKRNNAVKVLDIGCGNGDSFKHFEECGWKGEFVGTDFSLQAIATALKTYPGVKFIQTECHDQPYADGEFDVVSCQETIEHLEDPKATIEEVKRLVRKGGIAIITTPLGLNLSGEKEHVWTYEKEDFFEFFPKEEWKLQFVEGVFHYIIFAVATKL